MRPYISPKGTSSNYRQLDATKKLTVCLSYLKDTGFIWMTANTFGIHQSTVSKAMLEVCQSITKYLGPKFHWLPKKEEEMEEKLSRFEVKFGMAQILNCSVIIRAFCFIIHTTLEVVFGHLGSPSESPFCRSLYRFSKLIHTDADRMFNIVLFVLFSVNHSNIIQNFVSSIHWACVLPSK